MLFFCSADFALLQMILLPYIDRFNYHKDLTHFQINPLLFHLFNCALNLADTVDATIKAKIDML